MIGLGDILRALKILLVGFGPFMGLITSVLVLFGIGAALPPMLETFAATFASAVAAVPAANIGQYLGFANSFAPVTETLGAISILGAVAIGAAIFRIIKSWIPTVN